MSAVASFLVSVLSEGVVFSLDVFSVEFPALEASVQGLDIDSPVDSENSSVDSVPDSVEDSVVLSEGLSTEFVAVRVT